MIVSSLSVRWLVRSTAREAGWLEKTGSNGLWRVHVFSHSKTASKLASSRGSDILSSVELVGKESLCSTCENKQTHIPRHWVTKAQTKRRDAFRAPCLVIHRIYDPLIALGPPNNKHHVSTIDLELSSSLKRLRKCTLISLD